MPTNPFETTNPFAVTAPGVPSAQTVDAPTSAPTVEAQAQGYQATTAATERADPTLRTVQDNELVQKQLEQIIGNDSPLIQRARARATEQMNARGLVNSSMALGAADTAVYDAALPIAQADAATYGGAARDNQAVQNSMAQFNAGESNQTGRANAGLINQAAQFGAQAGNTASLANAESANRAALQTNQQQFQASTANADAANRMAMQTNDQQFRAALSNADPQIRAALSVLDNEFAAQRQASGTASEVWRQYQQSATAIMTSDLPAESKDKMIRELTDQTRQAMLATRAFDSVEEIDAILTLPPLPRSELSEPDSNASSRSSGSGSASGAGSEQSVATPWWATDQGGAG